MSQPLILKTKAEPSFFNKEAAIGFFITPILGSIVGAIIGKNRMEHEKEHGKTVSDKPSALNKDMLLGGLMGLWAAGIVAGIAGGITLAAGGGLVVSSAFAVAGLIASPIIGAVIGSRIGKSTQAAEYQEAKEQQIVRELSQNLSPEIAQAVEYRMANDKQWGKQMLEEKLLAAAQANIKQ